MSNQLIAASQMVDIVVAKRLRQHAGTWGMILLLFWARPSTAQPQQLPAVLQGTITLAYSDFDYFEGRSDSGKLQPTQFTLYLYSQTNGIWNYAATNYAEPIPDDGTGFIGSGYEGDLTYSDSGDWSVCGLTLYSASNTASFGCRIDYWENIYDYGNWIGVYAQYEGIGGTGSYTFSNNLLVVNLNATNYYYDIPTEVGTTDVVNGELTAVTGVSTDPPTDVGPLAATLNSHIFPDGVSTTTVYFQYGTDTNYGSITRSQTLGSGSTSPVSITADISDLASNSVYHYQSVAVAGAATNYGNDQTVTTEPSLLALATLSADTYDQPTGYTNPPVYQFIGGAVASGGFSVNAYASADLTQVVIAYRGTYPSIGDLTHPFFDLIGNITGDWGFVTGTPNGNLETFAEAAATFVQMARQAFPDANISLTGHSLGGALALMVGEESGLSATGFNAPGSAEVLPSLQAYIWQGLGSGWQPPSDSNPKTNYRLWGDQVSLAGSNLPPPAATITIATPLINLPVVFSDNAVLTFLSQPGFFFDSHSINTVVEAIQENEPTLSNTGPNVVSSIIGLIQLVSSSTSDANQTKYNFDVSVNTTSDILLDPQQTGGGTNFVFSVTPGSPTIAAVDLPSTDGVWSYAIRSETGNTWTSFQTAQPGTQFTFDPVNSIEIVPLDENGGAVTVSNFFFGIDFASTGTVSASLVQTSAPPPPTLQIALAGNQVSLAWNTNSEPGFALMSSSLMPPVSWMAVTNTPVVVGNQWIVTLPITNQSEYFLLSR